MVRSAPTSCISRRTRRTAMARSTSPSGATTPRSWSGDYVDRHPVPTCLRNHALLEEVKAGSGPIRMVTKEAFQDPHKETVGWENFLGMTIGQAVVWASQNIDPKYINPELTTSEPYVMGSHATCSGAWASGPEDYAPCGIPVGLQPDDDRRRAFRRRRHHRRHRPQVFVRLVHGRPDRRQGGGQVRQRHGQGRSLRSAKQEYADLKKAIYKPLENYRVGRNEIVAGTVSPSYLLPIHGLQRLEKIMDEYVGGIGAYYIDQRTAAHPRTRVAEHAEGRHRATSAPKTCTSFSARGSFTTGSWPPSP